MTSTMIEKVALLPCPFCGNKNVKYDCGSVDCDQCDTTGPYSSSGLDEATAAWNTRATIEVLREALTFSRKVLADERESLVSNYTNLSGPDIGKITDPDGKRWIAPFTKAIKKIDAALEAA